MVRQRKGKQALPNGVPLVEPGGSSRTKPTKPLIELSEEEQWRLINESGVLKKIPRSDQNSSNASAEADSEGDTTFGEQLLDAVLYVIPFSFLLLMMDILIHYQYHRKPTLGEIINRLIYGVPILSIFVYYTLRYKAYRELQLLLFAVNIISGCRLIYQINNANWLINMKQCPPLATIWIFTVFMADLRPAVLALLTVGSFVWWKELRIIL